MLGRLACFAFALLALTGCGDDTRASGGSGGTASAGGAAQGGGGAGTGASGGLGGEGGGTCVGSPDAPTVLSPEAGRIDVLSASLVMSASPFSDPDGGTYAGADYEIWSLKKTGELKDKVWHASFTGAAPPDAVTLADGSFDVAGMTELAQWEDYGVRVRYRSTDAGCSGVGVFSEPLPFRTDDGSTYLFDPGVVRDVYIDLPPASVNGINAEAFPPGCVPFSRDYYTGTLRFEGQTFDGVGVHIKGGCGSARDLGGKASFKINLDWDDPAVPGCPAERRLMGQKHLTLNNGVQDQSAIHEYLTYTLLRSLGVPASRLAWVRVFVNDQPYGLYQHVESIDRRFADRWFSSKEGMLYEGTYWCDLLPQNLPIGDEDTQCLTREFSPDACSVPDPLGDPEDYGQLKDMVNAIAALPPGGFYPAIDQIFDFDEVLTVWAVEAVIGHWDGYAFWIQNNYRVYHDPVTDRWSLIDTGVDQTFDADLDPWSPQGLLATRCLSEPACEQAFAAKLKAVKDAFVAMNLGTLAAAARAQIEPFVQADPRREYDMNGFANAQNSTQNFIAVRPSMIESYLVQHGFAP